MTNFARIRSAVDTIGNWQFAIANLPDYCRLFSAACLLLLVFSTSAFAQRGAWARQTSGSFSWLHGVFFLDQSRGWAVGSKGAFLATEDGGKTWKARSKPSDDILRDIYFSDSLNGWIVCERNVYQLKSNDDPRTYLMNTTDGGESWERVEIPGADVNARLVRAVFSPSGSGWAFGEGGAVYKSSPVDPKWVRLNAPTRHLLLGGTFIDDNRGWLVGAGSTILQTSDGGETWQVAKLADAPGIRFNATSFVGSRLGWAVGSSGSVYRTVNGGRTWQAQSSGVTADLYDVRFLDAVEGWAVGAEGTTIYTADGGQSWVTEQSNTTHPLERVFFADRTHGWAVGFGGTILNYVRAEAPRLHR
jgi:photosystem II stability/assembly factor-like uncharacterized protein